ncbi:hypothetical protein MLD38_026754 [Melastoma candidum]|uniref:Uncharacterized protein n=1 Tax=Melastoma candidum TaxID=119954 RepID=A0ACB9P154_9MYRT|nr:hypothetical protein MLD38_026754 [Melastoma candidum]
MIFKTLCAVITVVLFAFPSCEVVAAPDTHFKMLCNDANFTDGSPFASDLDFCFNGLMGPNSRFARYPVGCTSSGQGKATFHMESDCRKDLGRDDCLGCFNAIRSAIDQLCRNRMGVQVYLQDCMIRYESYDFRFPPDVSLSE